MVQLITWIIILLIILASIFLLYGLSKDVFKRKRIDKRLSAIATEVKGTEDTPIYIIDDYLNTEECSNLIAEFEGRYSKSPLTREDPSGYFRTSKTAYFDDKTKTQSSITNKILKTINLPSKCGEKCQIQYYKVGNEFKAHWDWFSSKFDKGYYDKGQRTWTFMVYLNDVEEGGETYFTKMDIAIKPKTGRAVVWGNLNPRGKEDYDTQHAGIPVKKGEKYIITKWFKLENNFY